MRRTIIILAIILSSLNAKAQSDPEYLMEIGAGAGMVNYLGDFNGSITGNMQPMATLMLRRLFNPYMGLRLHASYGKLKGSSADVKTYYPEYQEKAYEFSNTLADAGIVFEYNMWPYGTGRDYRGAKRLTPYIFGGLGATYVKTEDKSVVTANIPIGIGVKYKIGDRMNLGLQWAAHFSLNDELDGRKDPYTVESTGAFKNTDGYSTLTLTLTYSFKSKCRTCHNEDE